MDWKKDAKRQEKTKYIKQITAGIKKRKQFLTGNNETKENNPPV